MLTFNRGSAIALLVGTALVFGGCSGDGGTSTTGGDRTVADGVTFYIDAARGRDSNSGTSRETPWRTIAPIERWQLVGSDSIRLHGGQRFEGAFDFSPRNLAETSRRQMLTLSSYGSGRATVVAPPRTDAIAARNVAGIRVEDINLVGTRNLEMLDDGPQACRDGPAGVRLEAQGLEGTLDGGLVVEDANIGEFCEGLVIKSGDDESLIEHVRVKGVRSHDNGDAGVLTLDAAMANHSIHDVKVTKTRAYRNLNRGGIVLFGVDGGTVTDSLAYDNAKRGGGGVGIWAFDATDILFARNESYRNGRRSLTDDGDGFDFDRGVSNSVMRNNFSHDNGGVGFLVCSCQRYGRFYKMRDVLVEDNVSRNDGSSGQSSLYVLGGEPMKDVRVRSNRIESGVGNGPLVSVGSSGRNYGKIEIRENVFVSRDGKPLLEVSGRRDDDLDMRGNAWKAEGGAFRARVRSHDVSTLGALRHLLGERRRKAP